jgi:hypothetical protein
VTQTGYDGCVNRWMSVLSLVLCACGSSELPLPSIKSIAPPSMAANESILLTVDLDASPPARLDYGKSSAELLTSAKVSIGDRQFDVLQVEEQGKRLFVELPSGLPVGPQELRVTFSDGRQAVFASGFEITPALDITGLFIYPIGPQVRLKSFTIRIQMQGPDAELFQGRVKLSTNKGNITPTVTGPFQQGVRTQEVVMDDAGGSNVTITAEDYAGHSAISADFRLSPN